MSNHSWHVTTLQCAPHSERNEFVNFGVVIRNEANEPSETLQFDYGLHRLLKLEPEFDSQMFRGLLPDIRVFAETEQNLASIIKERELVQPFRLRAIPARRVIAPSAQDALKTAYAIHLPGSASIAKKESKREAMLRIATFTLETSGVWKSMFTGFSASEYTFEKDGLKFDFGYNSATTPFVRFFHVVAITSPSDTDLKALMFSWDLMRKHPLIEGRPFTLNVIVESGIARNGKEQARRNLLESQAIGVCPIGEIAKIGAAARYELGEDSATEHTLDIYVN